MVKHLSYVNTCYMVKHYHMIHCKYTYFPHYLLTNLTTKLTAGIQPAAHSFFSITNRQAPLTLLLLLLLPPGRILLIPKSFDSTTFNRKQLIMDINSIVYSCKQFILLCWFYIPISDVFGVIYLSLN